MNDQDAKRLNNLINAYCDAHSMSRSEIGEKLDGNPRWVNNAFSRGRGHPIRESAALKLLDWMYPQSTSLSVRDQVSLASMRAVLKSNEQRRAEIAADPSSAFVAPVLIDDRDVESFAKALSAYLKTCNEPTRFEANIKKFFRLPARLSSGTKGDNFTRLDYLRYHFWRTAYVRAESNGYGKPSTSEERERESEPRRLIVKFSDSKVALNAEHIRPMLDAIGRMTADTAAKGDHHDRPRARRPR